eukprot:SM000056S18006  [mRNA]  locus=s56:624650:629433:+ [translate_table: standard]
MGKKSKAAGKGRLDKFYHLAKEQGYRSRAAFKLVQLNRKYGFLDRARALLDLCAAPGGWLQVAVKHMPMSSLVVGVDLVPIRPVRGATTLVEDITTPRCRATLRKLLRSALLDVVLHDGSPNVGGAWAKESYGQAALSLDALRLATEFLKPGGTFVSKVFRSSDYNSLLYVFNQLFKKVESTKPIASRSTSAEIYVVGLGYKAPAKIDPRLLDHRHVFQYVDEPGKPTDVLAKTKQKRHRDGWASAPSTRVLLTVDLDLILPAEDDLADMLPASTDVVLTNVLAITHKQWIHSMLRYEEGVSLVHTTATVTDFVASDKPVELLGTLSSLTFNGSHCKDIGELAATDKEIVALCDDLRVLAKQEFKQLLKWRIQVRKLLPQVCTIAADGEVQPAEETESKEGTAEEAEEAQETELLATMEEMCDILDAKKRRTRKLLAKRKEKARSRTSTGMQMDAVIDQGFADEDLFSLQAIKSNKALEKVEDDVAPEDDDVENSDSEMHEGMQGEAEESGSDYDSDMEKKRYTEDMEEYFEEAYERYRKATDGSTKRRTRARLSHEANASKDLQEDMEGAEGEQAEAKAAVAKEEGEEGGANPLIVSFEKKLSPAKAAQQLAAKWFSQDLFVEHGKGVLDDEPRTPGREQNGSGNGAHVPEGALTDSDSDSEWESEHAKDYQRQEAQSRTSSAGKAGKGATNGSADTAHMQPDPLSRPSGDQQRHSSRGGEDGDGFEEVAPDAASSSDSESAGSMDSNEKAETLAYARRMLRKKQKEEILDAAYNRYMFDDVDLPSWFADDQRKYMRAEKPITKEEVEVMKAATRAINARPVKKVAEAKARKRRVAQKKAAQVTQKASAIADQEDLGTRAKGRQMERLYKNASAAKRPPKKELVVAKKGGKGNRGKGAKGKLMVDRRMKADSGGTRRGSKRDRGAKGKKKPKKAAGRPKSAGRPHGKR